LIARAGKVGEILQLLDAGDKKDRNIELGKGECVIADENEVLVLAGIKGGAKSGISENTQNIILEAANFDPTITRKFSTIYNLRSDTSKRFENEITPEYAEDGLRFCVDLILQIAGGKLVGTKDVYLAKPVEYKVSVSKDEIKKLLGLEISTDDISKILKNCGFVFEQNGEKFSVVAPHDRIDIRITEDLIEEIGRLYGYDKLVGKLHQDNFAISENPEFILTEFVRDSILRKDFFEVYSYAFAKKGEIELANTVSLDKRFMRTNLADNLTESLELNARNAELLGLNKIKIFEIGKIFSTKNEENQR
jgi:phenylalanyl-tRNA synthetase beta chain